MWLKGAGKQDLKKKQWMCVITSVPCPLKPYRPALLGSLQDTHTHCTSTAERKSGLIIGNIYRMKQSKDENSAVIMTGVHHRTSVKKPGTTAQYPVIAKWNTVLISSSNWSHSTPAPVGRESWKRSRASRWVMEQGVQTESWHLLRGARKPKHTIGASKKWLHFNRRHGCQGDYRSHGWEGFDTREG